MPFTEGTTIAGWGVVRSAPWHFAGIFSSQEEAELRAKELGPEYEVRYGENREGTDDFISTKVG